MNSTGLASFSFYLAKAFLAVFMILSFSQCSYEPDINDGSVNLLFSTDTIQFDTLFTSRQSITKRLKVFNPSKEAVLLNDISLKDSPQSFELIVNGVSGDQFNDILLLGEDSLLILIEANIDQGNLNNPFVIRDKLTVENKGISQSVIIEAWGQNAHFINDSILSGNITWTSEKPYVITNSMLLEENSTLTIEAGTKIYSGQESFILIAGQLNIQGQKDSLVVFTNDRLDEPFASAPGQWGGIILLEGSAGNTVKFADIKNAIVGFNIASYSADGNIDLSLENVKIGNMSTNAILSLNSDFEAINSLFYNTVSSTNIHIGGGAANYLHCTIANYFSIAREVPALYISDLAIDNQDREIIAPVQASLTNTIVYGRISEEILAVSNVENNLSFKFQNCIFRSSTDTLSANGSLLNQDPLFINTFEDNFKLQEASPAISAAANTATSIDLEGNERIQPADIGAYEYLPESQN